METLGNLTFEEPVFYFDKNEFYWDCTIHKAVKYPLYERYINCEITEEEFKSHKREMQTKNCYFCEHTQNGKKDGTLECTLKSSVSFGKVVNNLHICESFEKISETINE